MSGHAHSHAGGAYNASAELNEEPTYRGITGAGYGGGEDVVMDEDEMPVYRSLGAVYRSLDMAADQTLPQPALARQRPFAPFLIDDVDEGEN